MAGELEIYTGVASGINQTSSQVYTGGLNTGKGIEIKANPLNSGIVYIGNSGVTAEDGWPLEVVSSIGESVFLPMLRPSEVYVIGNVDSNQDQVNYFII